MKGSLVMNTTVPSDSLPLWEEGCLFLCKENSDSRKSGKIQEFTLDLAVGRNSVSTGLYSDKTSRLQGQGRRETR